MKVTEIRPKTYVVDFASREELMKTFIRFQEYYESPEFKHKIFTTEEFSSWYMKSRNSDTFTYYSDWSGCNVPSYVFNFFRQGWMSPLSERETKLLKELPESGEFYVIGVFNGGSGDVIAHEVCHSLFYSSKKYRDESLILLSEYKDELKSVEKYIMDLGYHPDVLQDETQAYICASKDSLVEKCIEFPIELHVRLNKLLKEVS